MSSSCSMSSSCYCQVALRGQLLHKLLLQLLLLREELLVRDAGPSAPRLQEAALRPEE